MRTPFSVGIVGLVFAGCGQGTLPGPPSGTTSPPSPAASGKDIVYVQQQTPAGPRTVPRPRAEAAAAFSLEARRLAEERIRSLRSWRLIAPDDAALARLMISAHRTFVRDYPGDPQSYGYLRDAMESEGALDLESLRQTLEATADKNSRQYASNRISFANLCLDGKRSDEALAVYEDVVKSGTCPPERLAEASVQMADIYAAQGRRDLAREHYLKARSLTDRFQHIESALARLDRAPPPPPSGTSSDSPAGGSSR